MTERNLTLGKLLEQARDFNFRVQIFGATGDYIAKFNEIRAEVSKHYTREELERLAQDTVLPTAIAEKYFEFRDFHNNNAPPNQVIK